MTKTTAIGYVNRNNQKVHGHQNRSGNDHMQVAYAFECLSCNTLMLCK